MQQRYYDPIIGRFYSNDPVGFSADNPMMFNRYAYANNNPYKFVDPEGLSPELGEKAFGVGLGLASKNAEAVAAADASVGNTGVASGVTAGQALNGDAGDGQSLAASVVAGTVSQLKGGDSDSTGQEDGENSRNKPPGPLKGAEGRPHSIVEKPGRDGQYTTHNGDGTWKQYRGSGKSHGGIPRPNVKEAGKNVSPDGRTFVDKGRVRPATADEIPGG